METFYTDNQNYVAVEGRSSSTSSSPSAAAPGDSLHRHHRRGRTTYTLAVTSKTGNVFSIAKAADGTVTRSCTRTEHQGRLPGQPQLVVSSQHTLRCEAGLRARLFCVQALLHPTQRTHTRCSTSMRLARPGRKGLHPDRAPGRHSDHRHPRRDRPSRLPRSARPCAGHRGEDQRPPGPDRHGDVLHRQPDLRRAEGASSVDIEQSLAAAPGDSFTVDAARPRPPTR